LFVGAVDAALFGCLVAVAATSLELNQLFLPTPLQVAELPLIPQLYAEARYKIPPALSGDDSAKMPGPVWL
jgi:hypothetical protein